MTDKTSENIKKSFLSNRVGMLYQEGQRTVTEQERILSSLPSHEDMTRYITVSVHAFILL